MYFSVSDLISLDRGVGVEGGMRGGDTPQPAVGRSNVNQRGGIILSYPEASGGVRCIRIF